MSENSPQICRLGNPYKLVDFMREQRKGVIAGSLKELLNIARTRFGYPEDAKLTVVLEQDGTEIDDEEYFATLEKNTNLMILLGNQKWAVAGSNKPKPQVIVVDDTDSSQIECTKKVKDSKCRRNPIGSLVSSLHSEPSQISLLAGSDLEMLSDMDPDSVADIVSDKLFLEQLKEASGRFLAEKRQAQESMALLHMYSSSTEMEQT